MAALRRWQMPVAGGTIAGETADPGSGGVVCSPFFYDTDFFIESTLSVSFFQRKYAAPHSAPFLFAAAKIT
ncbi:hypothetical protein [Insolitispirillum peregrinum]|uniref:hypothetical protein n=1 Tax=Insolitispirillum peregrinum TaxID=80876 RepID=UPI0011155054|nr:hypothetical protein [Insolitispirillum peregrinum]